MPRNMCDTLKESNTPGWYLLQDDFSVTQVSTRIIDAFWNSCILFTKDTTHGRLSEDKVSLPELFNLADAVFMDPH